MNTIGYPEWRWDRVYTTTREGRGPERVDTSTPDPTFRRRPVGFTADLDDLVQPEPRHRREVES